MIKHNPKEKLVWTKPKLKKLKFGQTMGGLDSSYTESARPGTGTS